MARERPPIDITNVPALRELIAEVRASNAPRVLRADSEDVAILMPVRPSAPHRRRAKTRADYDAFLASAGGWKDIVDTEQLKADIAASRAMASRPPVEL
jgi:hypothetical protein